MADLSITASSVTTDDATFTGLAGEALTAGQAVYQDPDDQLWYLSDANATDKRQVEAIALASVAAGQVVPLVGDGALLVLNSVLTVATLYCLSSTPGGIAPYADVASASNRFSIGYGETTTGLRLSFKDLGLVP